MQVSDDGVDGDAQFKALVLDRTGDRSTVEVRELPISRLHEQLPEGDVLVSVRYSSLNYKDALGVTGRGKVVRGSYPFIPGIDLVGTVVESESPKFRKGDAVVQTGWNLGEKHWGGFSQLQRVKSDWLIPLPGRLSMRDAMVFGTAGLTAMIAVMALEANNVVPSSGDVVVTGASGGVGSLAVAILADLGYDVVASTGSEDAHGYLRELGARRIISREELSQGPQQMLESSRWAGAVDTVGGATLATILSQLQAHGSVANCGNAGGAKVETNVYPFILRGINWLGIESNTCPNAKRRKAWRRLAREFPKDKLRRILYREVSLQEVAEVSRQLLDDQMHGRVVVALEQA